MIKPSTTPTTMKIMLVLFDFFANGEFLSNFTPAAPCSNSFNFTPRGMRRTYQDLARAAGIHDAVTRAISGHATPAMQLHYSTARGGEVKQALAKVAKLATDGAAIIDFRRARERLR